VGFWWKWADFLGFWSGKWSFSKEGRSVGYYIYIEWRGKRGRDQRRKRERTEKKRRKKEREQIGEERKKTEKEKKNWKEKIWKKVGQILEKISQGSEKKNIYWKRESLREKDTSPLEFYAEHKIQTLVLPFLIDESI